MKKIGTYKVETSFNISGRGIMALCQHVEGTIRLGAMTNLRFKGIEVTAKIIGYDMPKLGEDEIFRSGLLLKFDDELLTGRIAVERLKEQNIEILVDE